MVDRSYEENGNRIIENRMRVAPAKARMGAKGRFAGRYADSMGEKVLHLQTMAVRFGLSLPVLNQ
jgi:hypothetical protein